MFRQVFIISKHLFRKQLDRKSHQSETGRNKKILFTFEIANDNVIFRVNFYLFACQLITFKSPQETATKAKDETIHAIRMRAEVLKTKSVRN